MPERRRYARLKIPLEISYTIPGREPVRRKSITKDVSPNGARFAVKEELPKGAALDINIKIPSSLKLIPIKARIVWSKKESGPGKNTYDAGFEFIQIPEQSKQEFFQYLCNLMHDQLKNLNI